MTSRFFQGFAALPKALPVVFDDARLRRLTLAPALLSLVLSVVSAIAMFRWGHLLMERYSAGHGTIIAVLLWIALALAVAAAAWVAWLCAGVIATAPFADRLAERAEELAGAPPLPPQPLMQSARGIVHTVLAVVIYAALAVPLFLLHVVIPPLSPVTAVVGLLLTAQFLAYDIFDPALSRRGRSFEEKWRFLREHRAEVLGLGVAAALGSAVPLFGVIVPALAIVAASRLFVKIELGK
jgi:uncharacterized protein involved in cysteine biosynthesis